jgi:photosystem II stability/assembly factor-like uncharacterized protein
MKHHSIVTIIALLVLLPVVLIGCVPAAASPPIDPTQVPVEPTAAPTPTPAPTAIPTKEKPVGRWEEVSRVTAKQPVRMAAFLDETFGVTGGATGAGKTHYTTDGGATWTLAESSGGCLYGMDIVDEQTVWACGRMRGQSFTTPGGVRLSTDGGQTWEGQTAFKSQPGRCPLSFLDTQTGWVANARTLSATADGGETWEEITPDGLTDIVAIALRTPSEGYALDYDGTLYTTADGGKSWSSQSLGVEKYGELKVLESRDFVMAAIRFTDADNGIVVLSLVGGGESKVVALRTADGGRTWLEEIVPAETGPVYLSHDGSLLTVYSFLKPEVILFRYGSD